MKKYIAYCGLDCESCCEMDSCEKLGMIIKTF